MRRDWDTSQRNAKAVRAAMAMENITQLQNTRKPLARCERLLCFGGFMQKRKVKNGLRRIDGFRQAEDVEFKRIFEDVDLQTEIRRILRKYGLPIPEKELDDWLGYNDLNAGLIGISQSRELIWNKRAQRRINLEQDMQEIEQRFGIPQKFKSCLFDLVVIGKVTFLYYIGYPKIQVKRDGNDWVEELIITPETDINNPLVLEFIWRWQKHHRNLPPQPRPMKGNPRKLDWRAVWEWSRRHPSITRDEIARMLYRLPVTVRRKLEELDAELLDVK
ncbi:MAG: hypothetical protein N2559_17585 [Anaerolineae bacterium]|nr:hypothetical protein [Anaerolineae bacterium]